MDTKENKNEKLKKLKRIKYTAFVVLVLALIAIILSLFYRIISKNWAEDKVEEAEKIVEQIVIGEEGKLTTITQSSLEDVFTKSDLSTADYTFNAVAVSHAGDGELVDYYVAYNGTVKAGMDFSRIIIHVNDEAKVVELKIPKCEITDTIVDFGSMEYIFVNESAETESISQEAYKLCQEDLAKRAAEDSKLLELADKNAVDVIEALVKPWVEQIDPEYRVEIK